MSQPRGVGLVLLAVAACGGSKATTATTVSGPAAATAMPGHAGHAEHAAPAPSWKLDDLPEGAAIIENLGTYTRKVTTSVADAQAWFDQGLRLTYGFNHDEAARSFA